MEQSTSIKPKIGSEKSFGIIFAIIFLIFGLYLLIKSEPLAYGIFSVSILLLVISLRKPSLLFKLNLWWFRFGLFLGSIFAPIVMGVIYILIVVPTGLALRLFKKDPLNIKIDKNVKSYWISRKKPPESMKDQF